MASSERASSGQGVADAVGDEGHVAGDACGEIARAGLLHLLQGQTQCPLDEPLAQPGQHGLAEPGDQGEAESGGEALDDGDRHQQYHGRGDRVRWPVVGGQVDDAAEQRLDEQSDGRRADHDGEAGESQQPVRAQEFTDGGAGACRGGGREQPAVGLAVPVALRDVRLFGRSAVPSVLCVMRALPNGRRCGR